MSQTSTIGSWEQTKTPLASLNSSIGSLSPPRRSNSRFSKSYKVASNYFLTRRFAEALWTIRPFLVVTISGHQDSGAAPIATADKKWRIKFWSLYVTLHSSIIDLGPEDGKATVGAAEWEKIVAKVADGSLWDEVVAIGYGNDENTVDGEVVLNIANLLLTHSPQQSANQHHLETYLSSAPVIGPIGHHPQHQKDANDNDGDPANLVRELETRIQIIEIFALHVLPSNEEWDYARAFVKMNDLLDEDRKDAFLESLHELESTDEGNSMISAQSLDEEPYNAAILPGDKLPRADSEVTVIPARLNTDDSRHFSKASNSDMEPAVDRCSGLQTLPPNPVSASDQLQQSKDTTHTVKHRDHNAPSKRPQQYYNSDSLIRRSSKAWTLASTAISDIGLRVSRNPFIIWRFVLFLSMIVVAYSRKDLRQRLRKLFGDGLDKFRRTLGLGVKVSYI